MNSKLSPIEIALTDLNEIHDESPQTALDCAVAIISSPEIARMRAAYLSGSNSTEDFSDIIDSLQHKDLVTLFWSGEIPFERIVRLCGNAKALEAAHFASLGQMVEEFRVAENDLKVPPLTIEPSEPASEAVPMLAVVLGQGESGSVPERGVTRIEVQPTECEWLVGAPEDVNEPAVVEIEPLETGGLAVALGGFLKPSLNVSVKVTLSSSDGEVLSDAEPANSFLLRVPLECGDRCLEVNDRLDVWYRLGDTTTATREVRVAIVIR